MSEGLGPIDWACFIARNTGVAPPMEAVLLVIHLLACLALIGAVLLQRSEGGALGMGGGGTGGFISGRGVANVLVRTTMILGAGFFITSLVLARIHSDEAKSGTELERTIEQRGDDAFDPLSSSAPGGAAAPSAPAGTPPAGASTPPASTPAIDPLAPILSQPSTGAGAPATAPTGSASPASPAPATPTPAQPAPPN
jgi:preprotein translocase subunit SecG